MARTGVTLGCATPRSSICCLLVSYPLKNKKIHSTGKPICSGLQQLKASGRYQWILIDLPRDASQITHQLLSLCDHSLAIVNVDANCHIRLHQQALPDGAHILINDFRIGSQVQDDIYQLWLQSQRRLLPMLIHRDEAMAECLAAKQPVGEYRSDALAAEEILTLANWCLLNYSGLKTPVGSAS